jgi:NitT/TauT family transport system substrate-binding protein
MQTTRHYRTTRCVQSLRGVWLCALALCLLAVATGCDSARKPLAPVTLQLRWTHQAQFAGFYAADQQGFYAAEGLQVSYLEGGPVVDFIKLVLEGRAQFGIANADGLIMARAAGLPVRAIATIYRRSPGVYMALASSGITRPENFVGKTIEVAAAGKPGLLSISARAGVRPDQFTMVDPAADLSRLYAGQAQVRSVFLTNEVLTARAAGYQVNLIYPDDYGIHFYGDTLFTTDEMLAKQPDVVRGFLRASLKGWTYAVENANSVAASVRSVKPDADAAHENAFMLASLPLVNTGEDHIGWMKPDIWAGMEATLREQGILTKRVDVQQVYTLQFLKEIYP